MGAAEPKKKNEGGRAMSKGLLTVVGVVAALGLFSGGYWAGASTGAARESANPAAASADVRAAGGPGGPFVRGGAVGGSGAAAIPVSGRILSVNAESITIAVAPRGGQAGGASPAISSQIALVGSTTRVVRTTESDVKLSELKPGDQVTVVGVTDQTSGTISASAVVVGGTNVLGQILGGGPSGPRPSGTPGTR